MTDGKSAQAYVDCINTGVVTGGDNEVSKDLRHATHENSDRDAINAASFEKRHKKIKVHRHAKDSSLTFSDNAKMRTSPK